MLGSLSPKEESAARDPQVKSNRWHQRGRPKYGKLEANKEKERRKRRTIVTMGILEYYDIIAY